MLLVHLHLPERQVDALQERTRRRLSRVEDTTVTGPTIIRVCVLNHSDPFMTNKYGGKQGL